MMHVEQERTPWSTNAQFWVTIIRTKIDRYRTELTDRAVLDAAGNLANRDVLDVGCGEGYLVREVERRGARVQGVDLCPELVRAARDENDRLGLHAQFHEADMRTLPLRDNSVDLVLANHSINEVPDPEAAIIEMARVLRPGGRAILLMLHPCFFGWAPADDHQPGYRTRKGRKPYNVAGHKSPADATAYVATLSDYTTSLTGAGFVIEALTEPAPTHEQIAADPWWADKAEGSKFLLIAARLEHRSSEQAP